ncbi:MAG: YmiA family putative membrane protein [Mixta calida]|jgi:Flp pilus assembly protein TadB|uniref:YmiA family putative membrane protein n=1 Tax=Mixta calida TaxID=665913 RepID=A0ABN5H9Q1_9GAMM|nr:MULTISPECIES: YmiA family putative membrane protein [Mixta]MBS6057996.1 YmiA family putative membrane protein [Pantoea sp.]AUY25401.1 YmiA family putative membrane protein [Mixta calida]MCR1565940.1 YmiA family putative membrane protein [Mixta sp.]MDU4943142.1 YmiA family putative membrane protein [Mixta calida]QNU41902.1 YmiA family putative membrane protein [Mixta calida]
MAMRISVQPGVQDNSTNTARNGMSIRRKAWLAVFAASGLFWIVVALLVWQMWS